MIKKDLAYLHHILDAIAHIEDFFKSIFHPLLSSLTALWNEPVSSECSSPLAQQ